MDTLAGFKYDLGMHYPTITKHEYGAEMMTLKKLVLSASIVGLAASMSGCLDQNASQPAGVWKMHDVDGRPTLLNQESGDFYVLKDGHLIEIPKIPQKDLSGKTLKVENFLNLPITVEAEIKFLNGDLKALVTVDPASYSQNENATVTEEEQAALKKLEAIIKGKDEDYASVTLTFNDDIGVRLGEFELKQRNAQYVLDEKGEPIQMAFDVSEHMDFHEYASVENLNYFWSRK